jgi:hypothetical protein
LSFIQQFNCQKSKYEEKTMVICPWCGTNYLTFQPNCKNCGGPLQLVDESINASVPVENLPVPPLAPRLISDTYVWRLLFSDGWWIVVLVFTLLGFVFSLVGAVLTLSMIAAFVGIPFLLGGIGFLVAGGWVFVWRYQKAQEVVSVLRIGESTPGKIVEIHADYSVRVNGRSPWVIQYQFQVNGQDYEGTVTTFNPLGQQLQVGKAVYVLYLPMAPKRSTIYPHP